MLGFTMIGLSPIQIFGTCAAVSMRHQIILQLGGWVEQSQRASKLREPLLWGCTMAALRWEH